MIIYRMIVIESFPTHVGRVRLCSSTNDKKLRTAVIDLMEDWTENESMQDRKWKDSVQIDQGRTFHTVSGGRIDIMPINGNGYPFAGKNIQDSAGGILIKTYFNEEGYNTKVCPLCGETSWHSEDSDPPLFCPCCNSYICPSCDSEVESIDTGEEYMYHYKCTHCGEEWHTED